MELWFIIKYTLWKIKYWQLTSDYDIISNKVKD